MKCKLQRLVRTFISITPAMLLTLAMSVIAMQTQCWVVWFMVACMGMSLAWIGYGLFNKSPNDSMRVSE
jgi:hypothetical protein